MNKMLIVSQYKLPVIFFIFIGIVLTNKVYCQTNNNFQQNENTITARDTFSPKDSIIVKNAFFKLFKGKPGKAALYSLLIPGGGQLYNKKYWKFPIALAVDGGLGYNLWYQNHQYNVYQEFYTQALKDGSDKISFYRENRNKFRKAKEFAWLYLVLGHVLTTIDAYVDRHLIEFDISTDLTYVTPGHAPVMSLGFVVPITFNEAHFKKSKDVLPLF
jgi:hypothetical protein